MQDPLCKRNLNVGQEGTWQISKSKHRMTLRLIAHHCNSFVPGLLGRGSFRMLLNWYYSSFFLQYTAFSSFVFAVWLLSSPSLMLFSLISIEIGVACLFLHFAMQNKLELAVCFREAGSGFCWSPAVLHWASCPPASLWMSRAARLKGPSSASRVLTPHLEINTSPGRCCY